MVNTSTNPQPDPDKENRPEVDQQTRQHLVSLTYILIQESCREPPVINTPTILLRGRDQPSLSGTSAIT